MEITHFLEALWQLSLAMAPYILFGLIFAGILHEIVPDSIVTKHLGNDNITSVVKSTLFGIPLPVCSCGVIPLATSIKKSGASKGATLSFLISTPITGVDSILATYGIFGWIFTIYRVVTSMVIATAAGILTNIFDKYEQSETTAVKKPAFSSAAPQQMTSFSMNAPKAEKADTEETDTTEKKSFSFLAAMKYAFITLLGDIAKPLFWGLIIGALITVAIPDNLSEILKTYNWLSYLIVIVIAVPMYVCATASLPIAAGLMLSGVSAGAAFVFLSAGPATNTVTIGVVKKMLGNRSLAIYLGTIVIGSILFGLGLDAIFDASHIDPTSLIHMDEHGGIIATLSSIVLWGLVLYFLLKPYFTKKESCSGGSCCSS
ncbi:permease [Sulfurovum lithotrophicum]|uniref:Permease n=1 Tax=Sulfurovum lithotrophicum TaxID=206403 RepID=A0A7U4RR22_9BACT|nr:SO_0444 family Cu/Zn efflux transporter [Sulfurovum lithotrophicum]AKF25296.1 permease [Sulfurovum lithotrophicum]